MKIYFCIFFCFISSLFCCQTAKISDEETYEVINYILKSEHIFGKSTYWKINVITEDPNIKTHAEYFTEDFLRKNYKKYFSKKSIKSIVQQFTNSDQFLLDRNYVFDLRIIHLTDLIDDKSRKSSMYDFLKNKYNSDGLIYVSKPLFSEDKKMVIINYGYYCGHLCGHGKIVILKKTKERWTLEKEIAEFIN